MGLRKPGIFVETSGQKLLQLGSSKFADILKSATPGVLFIDEVYQLDPKKESVGQAITNAIMEAAENDRGELTIIVAGYRDDVKEKWMSFNPGLPSRFPREVVFEDFSESELRSIFMGIIEEKSWVVDNFISTDAGPPVDVATIAARRLVRSSNKKGFANARSVRVMVEQALRNASQRQKEEAIAMGPGCQLSSQHYITLTLHDVIGRPLDASSSPLVAELMTMTGLEAVKQSVKSLLKLATENYYSELRGEDVLDLSLHRMFLGNPGKL